MSSTPLTSCSMGVATVSASTFGFAPGYRARTTTVGGAISGYCAMGNWNTAIPPTSTMTMEMTAAKTGRRIKKWEKFMARSERICGGSFCFPQLCVHRDARPHAHQSFNDDLFARLQSGFHDAQPLNDRADCHRPELDLFIRGDDIDKLLRLVRTQRPVGNQQRRIFPVARNAEARKESRTQPVIRIGKHAASAQSARVRIHAIIHKIHIAPVRKTGFVGQAHLGRNLRVARADTRAFLAETDVFQDG